jgi:surfeit locus 1 family protein
MKLKTWVALGAVLIMASVCVRLGFWQLARWHEKQGLNARLRSSLAAAPRPFTEADAFPALAGRLVEVRGRFDESRQVLLSGRSHNGAPGVEVVTPLIQGPESEAVLVNRGWLYAADAATARPQDHPEPGLRVVRGIAEPLVGVLRVGGGSPRDRAATMLRPLRSEGAQLYSARRLDARALDQAWPYGLAPYVIRQLPGPEVPAQPARTQPRPYDETMHLSYAVQWFLFAAILVGGTIVLAWSRRRSA